MNYFMLIATFFISFSVSARDFTSSYYKHYNSERPLTSTDLSYLKQRDLILVPGLLSEVFSWEDRRVILDFSFLTTEYFAAQMRHFKHNLGIPLHKISASSKDINETKALIANQLKQSRDKGRKAIFIVHSLGGLALLEYLLETHESEWASHIDSILFLQTPFFGTPIADIYFNNPYHAEKWLGAILPFVNTSIETIQYLQALPRANFMNTHSKRIGEILNQIPTLTMSGVANGHKTIFEAGNDLIKHGCLINAHRHCLTRKFYDGPYDDSDGLVPLNSSRLPFVDSVALQGIDHGGTIVRLPFQVTQKEIMTEALLKLLIEKSNR